ncbi:shewanella-like protein phosphatase 1, putative [Plasmodium chabaudi chabaudi]|uniref:Shewanella-like protein phosphatase 1, putative n=1 Tax=Plasmodium chabaudi chabaudi TaxID=31271 RepID=A0A4V0KB35_PLACU|nr:shewanella-like protein phosphatase 1, putative [Plasmodium chabaudi chabaudi]VTZ70322.1 shewanella-like protein phosphatase 1, putative [Plasmodium chabaudi chabaudi]|eukprot:XP_739281.2 shewanella-like protein phosphatase 1, putative [Plasmodium chabaudi chabaudi]
MIFKKALYILLLLYIAIVKKGESKSDSKQPFLFKNLVIDKKKLDSSYYHKYDNIKWNGKIIAIGDLHGDIDSLKLILRHSELIDEDDNWIGDNVLLVQNGDVFDRGIYGPIIYSFLFKLQKEAVKKNSRVILIMGNHEQLNLCGSFHYVNPMETKIFFDNDINYRYYSFVSPNGAYHKRLIRLPPMVKVNNIIFTHGGLNSLISKFSINDINLKTRLQIENNCEILKYDSFLDYLSRDGVLWSDVISRSVPYYEKERCSELFHILDKYDAKYLVVGHTRQSSHKIGSYCNNHYFLIDTGMSLFTNDGQPYPSYLKIDDNKIKAVRLVVDKKKKCPHTKIQLNTPHKVKYCVQEKQTYLNEIS